MDYRIISADCHIDMTWMPGSLWVDHATAKWREQVPQVRETPDGPHWFAKGQDLGGFGGLGFGFERVQRAYSKHVEKIFEAGFYAGGPHPTTPALRRKDQEIDGIDGVPSSPGAAGVREWPITSRWGAKAGAPAAEERSCCLSPSGDRGDARAGDRWGASGRRASRSPRRGERIRKSRERSERRRSLPRH